MCGIDWLVRRIFWFGALILFGDLVCLVTFDFGVSVWAGGNCVFGSLVWWVFLVWVVICDRFWLRMGWFVRVVVCWVAFGV